MSRYTLELATAADDADLRRIMAATPTDGRVVVSFRREPSYFEAAEVEGDFRQVVAARDGRSGRLVGFGSRAIRRRYVNGEARPVGYLSSLRLLPEHRGGSLVARGYRFFRELHGDGRAALYLTTIAEGNEPALRVLTRGRRALPGYHFAGRYVTLALPFGGRRPPRGGDDAQLSIRPAAPDDRDAVAAFLQREGPRRQFFPVYRPRDLFRDAGPLRGLAAADLLLAFRDGRLIGTLGAWDQHAFKQAVVCGYRGVLRRARRLYNAAAWLAGRVPLPPPGEPLRYLAAALPVVENDDPAVFAALLRALLARQSRGGASHLLLGLHESDPLLAGLKRLRAERYLTRLYLVCWPDGDHLRASLDGRPIYLELGCL
jgi:hypothetical protein